MDTSKISCLVFQMVLRMEVFEGKLVNTHCKRRADPSLQRKWDRGGVFFDGRGGPVARGGGNLHNFYASLGDKVENSEIQVTIQGQTISSNYGKQASCIYNFEQLLSAGVENHLYPNFENSLDEKQRA